MSDSLVLCPGCQTPLSPERFNTAELIPCPGCDVPLQVNVFPALFKPPVRGKPGETLLAEGEAACYYHPQKRAAIPCDACGRFLCQVCDVEVDDQHLCPACLESGQKKGRLTKLENKRTLYDSIALATAVVPLLMWFVTLVTAPLAIWLAVYSWKQPGSLLPRTRIRSYLAIVFGVLQIAGWIFAITKLVQNA